MIYQKNLTTLTTFRLSPNLKDDAEHEAKRLNISLSDFIRQSISRNIHVAYNVEQELLSRISEITKGKR